MFATWLLMFGVGNVALDPSGNKAGTVHTFDVLDATGKRHTTKEWMEAKAIVLFIVSSECPASSGYAPEFARLFKSYGDKGVLFYGIYTDPDLTAQQATAHAKEHLIDYPVLLDPSQKLVGQTGAKRVPTAVILSPAGKILYRGRVDDRYISLGKKRPEPTQRDTENALSLVLAGKTPLAAETEVIGCLLPKLTEPAERKPK